MNGDIAQLLYGIKVNIAAIEDGDHSPQRLDSVRRDCIQMLELMKLFLISQRDSYYGYFLMNLTCEVDFTSRSIAGILLGRFPPVFHTNPLLLCKYSLKEILFIVCHEIDHIILNHPAEMLKANPNGDPDTFEKFNLAADASVNDRLLKEIKDEKCSFLVAPEGHVSSVTLKKCSNCAAFAHWKAICITSTSFVERRCLKSLSKRREMRAKWLRHRMAARLRIINGRRARMRKKPLPQCVNS